jgi:hypothetical protein
MLVARITVGHCQPQEGIEEAANVVLTAVVHPTRSDQEKGKRILGGNFFIICSYRSSIICKRVNLIILLTGVVFE